MPMEMGGRAGMISAVTVNSQRLKVPREIAFLESLIMSQDLKHITEVSGTWLGLN